MRRLLGGGGDSKRSGNSSSDTNPTPKKNGNTTHTFTYLLVCENTKQQHPISFTSGDEGYRSSSVHGASLQVTRLRRFTKLPPGLQATVRFIESLFRFQATVRFPRATGRPPFTPPWLPIFSDSWSGVAVGDQQKGLCSQSMCGKTPRTSIRYLLREVTRATDCPLFTDPLEVTLAWLPILSDPWSARTMGVDMTKKSHLGKLN